MQQILSVWSGLDNRRRIFVLGATIAVFAAVLAMSRMATQPTMSLLYSGLEPAAAGDVVAALDQQGVVYEVKNGSIYVEASHRDALRMTLAAEGLPANNGQGYELLDTLSGFGTTSQMFDAVYWRAKEGELARTIAANPQIKGARVHISNPSSNPFQRGLKPTASVTVNTAAGGLSTAQAKALKYLVASAVVGMSPEDVAIIDGRGGLVLPGDDTPLAAGDAEGRAAELKRNIQRILEARVGYGNAVVEVNVETVTEREAVVERRFDPESRVAISSETEERSNSSSGSQGGSVTVASNLPEGDAGAGENSSRSENSETRERVNYEVSETTREILRAPGAIKRVSVAVLVDGLRSTDATTGAENWEPRSGDEMEALRELVATAMGFNAERGDSITLKSMEFEPLVAEVAETQASLFDQFNIDVMNLIQLAVLAVVALALGLFVVRPILSSEAQLAPAALAAPTRPGLPPVVAGQAPAQVQAQAQPAAAGELALPPAAPTAAPEALAGPDALPDLGLPALSGEIDDGLAPLGDLAVISPEEMMNGAFGTDPAEDNDPVERLRKLIEERKEETVEILRAWMEDHEEPA